MIKRLIFDVDGTLITNVKLSEAITKALRKIGIYSEENLRRFLQAITTYEQTYNNYNRKDYLYHFSLALQTQLPQDFIDIFFKELKLVIPSENDKIQQTISKLSKQYELVLLTNYFKESQLNRLNNMGIGSFFIECYGEESIKPNKEAYLMACGKNHPSECVMIGDSVALDIIPAQNLHLKTIFVDSMQNNKLNISSMSVRTVNQINNRLIENLEDKEKNEQKKNGFIN